MRKLACLLVVTLLSLSSEAQNCQAAFTFSISGTTVSFTDASTNYSRSWWIWNFGDYHDASIQNPQHTYTVSGNYIVCLQIVDSITSCNSIYCDTVSVSGSSSSCQASFTSSISGLVVNFSGSATNYTGSVWNWNFGDNSSGSGKNKQHTYSSSGSYVVCLTISDSMGSCSNTYCDTINVTLPPCYASFTHSISGATVSFTSTSQNYSGNVYLWNFGDNSTGSGQSVQHTYSTSGTYNVCLTISDSTTNCSDTFCNSLTVSVPSCNAYFTSSISGTTVSFTDASQNYSGSVYSWDFGDGNSGNGQNVQHTYSASGSYNVCLYIFDSTTSCNDSFCGTISVNLPCQALFTYFISGNTVYFYDSSLNFSGTTSNWSFGDGDSAYGLNTQHTYNQSGTYTVWHRIYSGNCNDDVSQTITINSAPCQASFSYTTSGTTVSFAGSAQYYVGSVYSWNFGDGNTGIGQNYVHTFSDSGNYIVCLLIYDSATNCSDIYCDTVVVSGTGCQASFSHSATGLSVSFQGSSINYNGSIWNWSFGDSTTGSGQNVQHVYSTSGTYNVCLQISNTATGCSNTYCSNITVSLPSCQASFTQSRSAMTVTFGGSAQNYTGSIWSWNFGDANTGSGQNVQHTYSTPGVYQVCLSISHTATNCSYTWCDSVIITGCQASYTYSRVGSLVTFTNTTQNYSGSSFNWNFGDGNSGIGQNVQHTYSTSGNYTACLMISDATSSCTDTFCNTINLPGNNQVYGQVTAGTSAPYYGNVYLIVYNPNDSTLTAIDTTILDSGGYRFYNVSYGSYLVKAALTSSSPNYSGYLPTYYGNVLYWNQATYINVNSSSYTADISLISGTNLGGPGFIGGKTSQGANIFLDPGDPIKAVEVLLLDDMDNPIQYKFSDAIGSFRFDDLAFGTYKVYAEVLGKKTTPAFVTIDETNPSISDLKIIIGSTEVTTYIGENRLNFIKKVSDIYPNPGENNVFIDVTLIKPVDISLRVHNGLGQLIYTNNIKLSTGSHIIPINTVNWGKGVYYLEISDTQGDVIFKKYLKY